MEMYVIKKMLFYQKHYWDYGFLFQLHMLVGNGLINQKIINTGIFKPIEFDGFFIVPPIGIEPIFKV